MESGKQGSVHKADNFKAESAFKEAKQLERDSLGLFMIPHETQQLHPDHLSSLYPLELSSQPTRENAPVSEQPPTPNMGEQINDGKDKMDVEMKNE